MKKAALTPFEQALLDAAMEEFADIPGEDEIEHSFPPEFEEKADRLIRQTRRKTWKYVNSTVKKLILVAVIAAMLATTVMAGPAIWQFFIDFFFQDVGTHYEFTYDPELVKDAPEYIETVYAPTYIPDGFEPTTPIYNGGVVILTWLDEEQNGAVDFVQRTYPDDPLSGEVGGISADNAETSWIQLGGGDVLRIELEEVVYYCWSTSEYCFQLMSRKCDVSEEEMQKIFYSIAIDEDAVIE